MNRRTFFKNVGITLGCVFLFKKVPKPKFKVLEQYINGSWQEIEMETLKYGDTFRVRPNSEDKNIWPGGYIARSKPYPDPNMEGNLGIVVEGLPYFDSKKCCRR